MATIALLPCGVKTFDSVKYQLPKELVECLGNIGNIETSECCSVRCDTGWRSWWQHGKGRPCFAPARRSSGAPIHKQSN